MFVWLGAGAGGRRHRRPAGAHFKVGELLPRWSGDTLDLVVDFITYVFVPAYAIVRQRLVAAIAGDPGGHRDRGHRRALFRRPRDEDARQLFPRLSGGVERRGVLSVRAEAAVLGRRRRDRRARVLTFVPVQFVHPLARAALRALNIALMAAWAVLAVLRIVAISIRALGHVGAVADRRLFPDRGS